MNASEYLTNLQSSSNPFGFENAIGETIFEGINSVNGPINTVWMPRLAGSAIFALEIIALGQDVVAPSLTWTLQTKNQGDATATDLVSSTATTVGIHTTTMQSSLLDTFRFKLETGSGTGLSWMRFRVLSPAWAFDQVGLSNLRSSRR